MGKKLILIVSIVIAALGASAFGATINETLDTTAPAASPVYRAETGAQTGRLNRNGIASACGSLKANPGNGTTVGSRRYDEYRFIALSGGCVTVTLSNAGDNLLFGAAYDEDGINVSDTSVNYLADMGASPTAATPTRSFSFDVVAGQIFHIVVHELNPAGAIGQTYTLDVDGVKIEPDFTVTEVMDITPPQLHPAYSGATGLQTGRLNRFAPPSDCASLKPNPGLFAPTGFRQADLYAFTPASSGCARVTLSHTGADSVHIVVYNQNGYVPSNPSTNYLADSGSSAVNNSKTFSFRVTRGIPFFIVVSEVTPGAAVGSSYTMNISNVELVPKVRINATLDTTPPPANPDYVGASGLQTGRITRASPVADCNAPKPFPGLFSPTGSRQYDEYMFVPGGSGCVEVTLRAFAGFDLYAVAYNQLGFVPANPGTNYLADPASSPNLGNPKTFSFSVTAGVPFTVVVHEVNPGGGVGQAYTLEVGGVALNVTPVSVRGDADGDFKADLYWRENAPGTGLSWWLMNGSTLTASNYNEVGSEWQIADVGDLDGDGKADLVWRRASDGAAYLWTLNGLGFKGFFDLGVLSPATWSLVGAADLDGNGKADLVWRNVDGTVYGWLMNGGTIASQGVIGNPGAEWQVIDLADMDGDRKADLVFRNTTTGQVFVWFMNGLALSSAGSPGGLATATWNLLAAADFDGDGKGDLLWRSTAGDTWVWIMNGASFVSGASIGNPGLAWTVRSVADFDGDGKADLVWRHTDGTTFWWKMNGAAPVAFQPIANPGGFWQIVSP